MSYKDGIPLLASFEDDVDDDDLTFQNVRPAGKCRCSKRTFMFSVVLGLAIALILALIVGVTVPVVLLKPSPSAANTGSGIKHINKTSDSASVSASDIVSISPLSVTQSVSTLTTPGTLKTMPSTNTLHTQVSKSISSPPTAIQSSPPPIARTPIPSSRHNISLKSTSELKIYSLSPTSSLKSVPVPTTSAMVAMTSVVVAMTSVKVVTLSSPAVVPTTTFVGPIGTPTPTAPPPLSNENCTLEDLICRSKLDDRQYTVTTLSNGLRVLLISDPNSNISAAAMDIPAGSFNDPRNYEGLAHFCEHMLFIGTRKYPQTNQYSHYLQTHGGLDNAHTSTQNTNYFFNVEADYFSTALDMFAHFFIDPLFSIDSVMDEMNAVNAEHEKNLQSDGWKVWQLLKNVSNPAHPFSQFNTGSLETLNKSDIHEQLLRYYNNSYSANTMQLVVYGREDLDTLNNMAVHSFSDIPNRNLTKATYSTTSFPPQYSGVIIHFYPVANRDTLFLYWQITPSLQPYYRHAVGSFIKQYLSHEGTTSVAYKLKNLNYVTSLSSDVDVETDSYTLYTVQMELTDEGVCNVSGVIQILFQYIGRFQSINESEFNQLWQDFVSVSQIRFDYSERSPPISYVSDIASAMRTRRDPADFLGNPLRYQPCFNLTSSALAKLTPNNSVIFLGTHRITFSPSVAEQLNFTSNESPPLIINETSGMNQFPWPELDEIEPLYLTPYHRQTIPEELLEYWEVKGDGSVQLPPRNTFIPNDLLIINKSSNDSNQPTRLSTEKSAVSLWWLLDTDDFHEPRVNIRCLLNNTNVTMSPSWEARSRLFAKFIEAVLQPDLYDATLVGSTYSVEAYTHGLMISLSGLAGTMGQLISSVASMFSRDQLSPRVAYFNTAKAALIDELRNFNYTQLAFRYTYQYIQRVVMERPYWRNEEILAELEGLNITEVIDFGIGQLLMDHGTTPSRTGSGTTLLCFVHGNIDETQAKQYVGTMAGSRLGVGLLSSPTIPSPFGHYWQQRLRLSEPGNYSVVIPTLNPEDQNSVVNVFFQVGDVCVLDGASCSRESLLRSIHLSLLTQLLKDHCFTFLRTVNKLGYVAFCFSWSSENVGSFQVLVQSEAFDGEYVYEKISEFLEDYVVNNVLALENNYTELVQEQKAVLKLVLQRKDDTLSDRTSRLWNKIKNGQLTFDLRQQWIELLDSNLVNSTSVLDFYMEHIIHPNTYRKMIIAVNGKDKNFQPDVDHPLDYASLSNCLIYPNCSIYAS